MSYPYRYAPGAEVLGQAASAIFNHMLGDEVMESLRKHGVDQLKPEEWYPVDKFIEVFADWFRNSGNSQLVSVGMAIIDNAVLPTEMETAPLVQKLMLLSALHDINHRGTGDPGRYVVEQVGEKHLKYTTNTPYPDDMIYGYIHGVSMVWRSASCRAARTSQSATTLRCRASTKAAHTRSSISSGNSALEKRSGRD